MNVKVQIDNAQLFGLVLSLLLVAAVGYVRSSGGTPDPSVMGHPASEIDFSGGFTVPSGNVEITSGNLHVGGNLVVSGSISTAGTGVSVYKDPSTGYLTTKSDSCNGYVGANGCRTSNPSSSGATSIGSEPSTSTTCYFDCYYPDGSVQGATIARPQKSVTESGSYDCSNNCALGSHSGCAAIAFTSNSRDCQTLGPAQNEYCYYDYTCTYTNADSYSGTIHTQSSYPPTISICPGSGSTDSCYYHAMVPDTCTETAANCQPKSMPACSTAPCGNAVGKLISL